MRQLNSIVQVSLDGFVAGPRGEFDQFVGGEENLEFVCSITETADAAMFGRISWQLLDAHWPTAGSKPGATKNIIQYSNWYNGVSKYVFSKTLKPADLWNVSLINDCSSPRIEELKQEKGKDILIFGSPSINHALMGRRQIDHLWLIVHPVMFGGGIPLFRPMDQAQRLTLVRSVALTNGTLCNLYSFSGKK